MLKKISLQLIFAIISVTPITAISALELTQHLKYHTAYFDYSNLPPPSLNSSDTTTYNTFNYRLNLSEKINSVKFDSHYQLSSLYSNNHDLSYINPDRYKLFNLSASLYDNNEQVISHRLDRLFITYSTDSAITKFGRQAITWGNGLVYNVIDIFNPFSPTAIDKEYKVGDDMLYTQFLTSAGNDWQILYLPRRNKDLKLSQAESSFAIKYHATHSDVDFDVLLSQHYSDVVIGAGVSTALGETLWRLDITHTETSDNQQIISLVTNIDYSWIGFNKNMYGFVELYHNGFGNKNTIDPNNNNLNARISRGEIFTYFTNHLALGLNIELHPLLKISPSIIQDIDNNTTLLTVSIHYDWKQNLTLSSSIDHYYDTNTNLNSPDKVYTDVFNINIALYF